MKGYSGSRGLSVLMLLLGVAALVLRKLLYIVAVDAKGLLLRNHPLEIVLEVLTGLVLVLVLLSVRKTKNNCVETQFAANLPAALGNLAAGAGILATVMTEPAAMGGYLESLWQILGLAAPVGFLVAAFARVRGKMPFFGLHVVGCLFFVLHIVSRYQMWSGDPQMQEYIFSLLGAMTLMFFAFYTAAMEAGCANLRVMQGMGLVSLYLCTAELARSACPWLYLGGLLWVLTELTTIQKIPSDEKR